MMTGRGHEDSRRFDDWLAQTVALPPKEREAQLTAWEQAPSARAAHPREEHLLPLMVAAGAGGDDKGAQVFRDEVMSSVMSAARFG